MSEQIAMEVKGVAGGYQGGLFGAAGSNNIHDINFTVTKGEIIGIIGESECGKSALALALAGKLKKRKGTVNNLKNEVQLVPQNPEKVMNLHWTLKKYYKHTLKKAGIQEEEELVQRVVNAILSVGLSQTMLDKKIGDLSNGQRKRALIAHAIMQHPDILILDDPMGMLDIPNCNRVIRLIKSLKAKGKTVIVLTTDFNLVRDYCDEIMVMDNGTIVEQGSVQAVMDAPRMECTKKMMKMVSKAVSFCM